MAGWATPHADDTVELPDGRVIAHASYGDPQGSPCLYFPGTASSRWEAALFDAAGRKMGARIIGVERPGFGRSTRAPRRTLADWPADVDHAAETLALATYGVIGYSGGGPHALACAARSNPAPTACVLLNAVAPAHIPEVTHLLTRQVRTLLFVAHRWPRLMQATVGRATMRPAMGETREVPRRMRRQLTDDDLRRHQDPEWSAAQRANISEGVRQGVSGTFNDWEALWHRPWGFDAAQITVPIHALAGEEDTGLPWARWLTQHNPAHTLWTFEGGHFSFAAPAVLERAVAYAAGRPT